MKYLKFLAKTIKAAFSRLAAAPQPFPFIWLGIYLTFVTLDIIFVDTLLSTSIKYLGIILNLFFVHRLYKKDHLLALALSFTLLADTILIWLNAKPLGVYAFVFAQFFHTARLAKTTPKFFQHYLIGAFVVFSLALIAGLQPIYAISLIYGATLLTNLFLSIKWLKTGKNFSAAACSALGFFLFLACDSLVASEYVLSAIPTRLGLSFFVWLFYYPSQVLISNSSTKPLSHRRKTLKPENRTFS
jgi:heme exporter protein D